jgi:hypothetical protein
MKKSFDLLTYGSESNTCYGLEIVRRRVQSFGGECVPYSVGSGNPVLASLYWPEQLYDFIRHVYSTDMKGRSITVGGNYATTSPSLLMSLPGVRVFLGDGELFDPGTDAFIAGPSPIDRAVTPSVTPMLYEDVQQTRRTFCEISRGCNFRCLFCQYGWLKPYREADVSDIKIVLGDAKTKSIRVFAANRFAHKRYQYISAFMDRRGLNDTGSDVTVKDVMRRPELLAKTAKVRIGIEGLSRRLRYMVGKPYSNELLVEFFKMAVASGKKTVDAYMIYGLPTETKDDLEDFKELLLELDRSLPAGFVLALHWNAFQPNAQTPFQWAAPATGDYSWLGKFLDTWTENKRIKIYHKPKLSGRWTVIRRVFAVRATADMANLAYAVATREPEMKRKQDAFLRKFEEIAGYDMTGEIPVEKRLPWDDHCIYQRDTMLRLWNHRVKKARG